MPKTPKQKPAALSDDETLELIAKAAKQYERYVRINATVPLAEISSSTDHWVHDPRTPLSLVIRSH